MTQNNCFWTHLPFLVFCTEVLHTDGEASTGLGSLCIRNKVVSLYVPSQKNMHKDTWVFLRWLNYDSFPDSLPIFINCQKINHFPPMCSFLYFPPAHPVPSLLYSLLASFVALPFVFSFFLYLFKGLPPIVPYSYPALLKNTCSSKPFLKWVTRDAADSVQRGHVIQWEQWVVLQPVSKYGLALVFL